MDSKQFNRVRSNAMAEASWEHRNLLKEVRKLQKELDEAGSILRLLTNTYGLRESQDDKPLLPYKDQPPEIQHAIGFLIEVIDPE